MHEWLVQIVGYRDAVSTEPEGQYILLHDIQNMVAGVNSHDYTFKVIPSYNSCSLSKDNAMKAYREHVSIAPQSRPQH
jgi:hypothetical protein